MNITLGTFSYCFNSDNSLVGSEASFKSPLGDLGVPKGTFYAVCPTVKLQQRKVNGINAKMLKLNNHILNLSDVLYEF